MESQNEENVFVNNPTECTPNTDAERPQSGECEKSIESALKFVNCTVSLGNAGDSGEVGLELPEEFVSNPDIFYQVLSKKTWDEYLNDDQRSHLSKFLPETVPTTKEQVDGFVDKLFHPSSSYLTNPIVDFQQKLQAGYYDDVCSKEIRQLKDCARLQYDYRIREYYGGVLKKLLLYRRKLLEAAASVPDGVPFNYDWKSHFLDSLHRRRNAIQGNEYGNSPTWNRAQKRARMMIMDCKARAGEYQVPSSDDEDYAGPPLASATSSRSTSAYGGFAFGSVQHRHGGQLDSGRSSSVRSTLAKQYDVDLDLHEPVGNVDTKDMLKEYRYLRKFHSEHPSLEFDDIELDDIIDRCDSEIKLLAQKCGVYKKQEITSTESNSCTGTPSIFGGGKKAPAGRQHSKATVTVTKD